MHKILICDTFEETKQNMAAALQSRCELTCISNEVEFQEEIKVRQYDLIFLDIDCLADSSMNLFEDIHNKDPFLPIIMTSKTE